MIVKIKPRHCSKRSSNKMNIVHEIDASTKRFSSKITSTKRSKRSGIDLFSKENNPYSVKSIPYN